jgi:hypothetical protein
MSKRRSAKRRKKFIPPVNPYTGEVSVLAIMENIGNGFLKFPKNAGRCK